MIRFFADKIKIPRALFVGRYYEHDTKVWEVILLELSIKRNQQNNRFYSIELGSVRGLGHKFKFEWVQ